MLDNRSLAVISIGRRHNRLILFCMIPPRPPSAPAWTPPAAKKFFCSPKEGTVEGPFDLIELAGLLRAKHISPETPVVPEGEEQWLFFEDRPEYVLAKEMSPDAIQRHLEEKAKATESSWSPRRMKTFLWVMAPLLLLILWRIFRAYLHYVGQSSAAETIDSTIDSSMAPQ